MRRSDFARLAAAAAAFGGAAVPGRAQTAATTMRVGVNSSDDVTPLLWAQTGGLFAKAGLSVDIQKFPSGSTVTAAVLGGSLDAGRSSMLPLINAHNRGIPVQIIAPGDLALPTETTEGMIVAKTSTVTGGKDLNGSTLPVPSLHDFNEIATRAWIDATGGDSRTVRFTEMPISSIPAAIAQGRVPAGMVTDPFLRDAIAAGGVKIIGRPNQAIAKRYMITCYFSTAGYIEANRDAVIAFGRTLNQSLVYTNAHHAEAVAAVAPFWGITASVIANMEVGPVATTLDPKDIQPLIDAAVRYGVIDKPFPAEDLIAPAVRSS